MARVYAGILGPLAFLTSLAHGALHAQTVDSILWHAWLCLVAFASAGAALGWIAGRAVEESVQATMAAEVAAADAPRRISDA